MVRMRKHSTDSQHDWCVVYRLDRVNTDRVKSSTLCKPFEDHNYGHACDIWKTLHTSNNANLKRNQPGQISRKTRLLSWNLLIIQSSEFFSTTEICGLIPAHGQHLRSNGRTDCSSPRSNTKNQSLRVQSSAITALSRCQGRYLVNVRCEHRTSYTSSVRHIAKKRLTSSPSPYCSIYCRTGNAGWSQRPSR